MACLLDTTNMAYSGDPLIPPDNNMFSIDHVDLYGKVSGKNAPAM